MPERRRLFVDYSRYGHSLHIAATVSPGECAGLAIGDEVIVEGDSHPDYVATVTAIEGSLVALRLSVDQNSQPYQPQPCPGCGHDDSWHTLGSGRYDCFHDGCRCSLDVDTVLSAQAVRDRISQLSDRQAWPWQRAPEIHIEWHPLLRQRGVAEFHSVQLPDDFTDELHLGDRVIIVDEGGNRHVATVERVTPAHIAGFHYVVRIGRGGSAADD